MSWRAPLPPLLTRVRLVMAVEVLPLALATLGVWFVGVSAFGVAAFLAMYLLTMLGIELGMHRMIAHRQLRAIAPLRAILCVLGSMAGEGSPLLWSAIHREHHRAPDNDGDPHSPVLVDGRARRGLFDRVRGFVWSQSLWYAEVPGILRYQRALRRRFAGAPTGAASMHAGDRQAEHLLRDVEDWLVDPLVVRLDVLYPLWVALGFVLPALAGAIAGAVTGGTIEDAAWGGLDGLVWGGLVRLVVVQKVSFAINSVGHTLGARSMQTNDNSRNNVVMAVLTLGSGWHNNHHAFPGAASVRFSWWQIDPSGALIWLGEKLGWVDDVRRADPALVAARRWKPGVSA